MAEQTKPGLWTDPEDVPRSLSKGNSRPPSYVYAMEKAAKRGDDSTYFMRKTQRTKKRDGKRS